MITLIFAVVLLYSGLLSASDLALEWKDLYVKIPPKSLFKPFTKGAANIEGDLEMNPDTSFLLKNASGFALEGEVLAIIGPSGSSKSTLLNALTGLIDFSGSVLFGGTPIDPKTFIKRIGLVPQEPQFQPRLTVYETLMFHAKLRVNSPDEQRIALIDQILEALHLTGAKDTAVGDTDDYSCGISGGEKRRLAIATELLSNPSIIFLDEPTTGLDAAEAFSVMRILKRLAKEGKTVITIIHQARLPIFSETIDNIIVMWKGTNIFQGSFNDAISCFQTVKGSSFEPMENPADIMLDWLTENDNFGYMLKEEYLKSYKSTPGQPTVALLQRTSAPCSWFSQFSALSRRDYIQVFRGLSDFHSQVFFQIFISILTGIAFLQLSSTTMVTKEHLTLLAIVSTFSILSAVTNIVTIPNEFKMRRRELRRGLYKLSPYLASKAVHDVIQVTVFTTIVTIIIYFMTDMGPETWSASNMFKFFGINLLGMFSGSSAGLLFGSMSRGSEVIGMYLLDLYQLLGVLFSGTFISTRSLKDAVSWLGYLLHTRYMFAPLAINQLRSITLICDPAHVQPDGACLFPTDVEIYLKQAGVDERHPIVYDIVALIIFSVVTRIMAFVILKMQ